MAVLDRMTPEQKRQIAIRMAGMNYPGVRQAWLDDPRTSAAQTLLEQGASTDPVAAGGWGWLSGLTRLGAGFLGGKAANRQFQDYSAESGRRAQLENQGRLSAPGGAAPIAVPGAGIPPEASADVAMPTNLAGPQSFNGPVSGNASPLPGIAQSLTGQPPNPIQPPVVNRGQSAQAVPVPSTVAPTGRSNRVGPRVLQPGEVAAPHAPPPAAATGFNDYRSSAYEPLEAAAEQKYGLPHGILKSIRVNGERSNSDQVSPTGAKSVYQFVPGTRRRFLKTYGVDAWSGPQGAVEAAALHLRDSMKRNGGDVVGAVKDYRGYNATHDDNYIKRVVTPLGINYDKGSASGGGGGGSVDMTGTSFAPMDVPPLPAAPERPVEPTIDPIRQSPRRALAEHLMRMTTGNNADANALYPVTSELNKLGWDEEADLNKQREENVAQLRHLGYQSDMQNWQAKDSALFKAPIDEREAIIEANLKGTESEREFARRMAEQRLQNQGTLDVANARQTKEYNPNDPRVMRMITPFAEARDSATNQIANTGSIMAITASLGTTPFDKLPYFGGARAKYSANVDQLERLRTQIVYELAHGKLGAGFSEGDRKFIEAMHPFSTDVPIAAMRRDALILQRYAQRAQMYNQGAIEALGNGTYPQFQAKWGKYTSQTPIMKGNLPIKEENVPSYDDFISAGQ